MNKSEAVEVLRCSCGDVSLCRGLCKSCYGKQYWKLYRYKDKVPTIKNLKEDFFKHFSRVCYSIEDWEKNSELFAKTACILTNREQCILQEEILKEVRCKKIRC